MCNSSECLEFLLFADDTNVFISGDDITELFSVMNKELMGVANWCKANVLSLNVKKTVYMLFHKARKNISLNELFICIGDSVLSHVDACKFLGIVIDEHLTFKPHIQYVTNKLSKNIGIISRIRPYTLLYQ